MLERTHVPFFPIPNLLPCPFLRPSRNSDPGSHCWLFSPLPATVRALNFYREKTSAFSSLVDLRRTAPTHARRSRLLMTFRFSFLRDKHHDMCQFQPAGRRTRTSLRGRREGTTSNTVAYPEGQSINVSYEMSWKVKALPDRKPIL